MLRASLAKSVDFGWALVTISYNFFFNSKSTSSSVRDLGSQKSRSSSRIKDLLVGSRVSVLHASVKACFEFRMVCFRTVMIISCTSWERTKATAVRIV